MSWCKLDGTFARDPKWKHLGRMLGIPRAQAAGHAACLYSWAANSAPDGDVSALDDEDIEDECLWEGESGALVAALSSDKVGVLEKFKGRLVIHGYMERAETHKAAVRMKRMRERKKHVVTPPVRETVTNSSEPRDVTVTSQFGPRDVTVTGEREEREDREEKEEILDLAVAHAQSAQRKSSKGRPPAQQARAAVVRDAWRTAWEEYYQRPLEGWGAPQNTHIYRLLESWTPEQLANRILAYFDWEQAGSINAGHPFMAAAWSFSAKIHELNADMIKPQRRVQGVLAKKREREAEKTVGEAAEIEIAMKLLEEGDRKRLEGASHV